MIGVRPEEQRQALGFGARGVLAGLALGLVWLLALLLSSWSAAIFASGQLKD